MMMSVNRITFINLQGQVVTTDSAGYSRRILTEVGRVFQFPAWAPDGSGLAAIGNDRLGSGVYLLHDQPSPPEPVTLYRTTADVVPRSAADDRSSSRRQEPRDDTPIYLYWSPDSRKVSFITSHPHEGLGLRLVEVESRMSQILATGRPLFWDWTPDAGQILIHTAISSLGARLAFIDARRDGQGANLAQPGAFQAPGVARSGRRWAYAEADDFDNSQLVVDGLGGVERLVIPHKGMVALSWCPASSEKLAFISPPFPAQRFYGQLQVVDLTDRSVRVLVEDTVLAFFWSPNGQYLAYLTLNQISQSGSTGAASNRTNGVYGKEQAASNGRQGVALATSLSLELWLVEVTTGQSRQLTTFAPVPLFVNQFLPFFDQYALSHRLWSPASDALLLPVMEGESPQIMLLPIDGSRPRLLEEGIIAFWSWQ